MTAQNLPQEPGFYWAKSTESYGWWNIIVYVCGELPYLHFFAWELVEQDIIQGSEPPYDWVFGEKIQKPQNNT